MMNAKHDMTEVFDHPFGDHCNAPARRWRNPDGSKGGIVAVDAQLNPAQFVCASAVVWPRAVIGDGASIGDGSSIGDGDWWLSGGPCGSRDAFWTAVYSHKHGLRWWIGCQYGITTDALCERIAETHGNNQYAQDYLAVIAFVESHPGLLRAKSKEEV